MQFLSYLEPVVKTNPANPGSAGGKRPTTTPTDPKAVPKTPQVDKKNPTGVKNPAADKTTVKGGKGKPETSNSINNIVKEE